MSGTAVYGTVRTVVWEDGGRKAPSYPILELRAGLDNLFSVGIAGSRICFIREYTDCLSRKDSLSAW